MCDHDTTYYCDLAAAAAHSAGELLGARFRRIELAAIQQKSSPTDLVSVADRESEDLLRQLLPTTEDSIGFIGEESAALSPRSGPQLSWVVDPLDGTANYLAGLPIWAVSVALCDMSRAEPAPLVAVVHAPLLGRTWTAARGRGARLNGAPIRVRPEPPGGGLANAMIATGFPYGLTERDASIILAKFSRMQQHFHKVRRLGAAAVDLAFVADGTFDGMWELSLKLWDVAAGMLLIREAGGTFEWWFPPTGDLAVDIMAASRPDLLELMRVQLQLSPA